MSLNETLQKLKKGNIEPVYLLHGTERYFVEQIKNSLSQGIAEEMEGDATSYDLTETPVQEVLRDAETIPFFAERKLIFANNPVFLKTKPDSLPFVHEMEGLQAYLKNPAPFSTLVFIAPYEKLDERKKVTKALKQHAKTIDCNPIKENELRKWILFLAKRHRIDISEDALFLLESEFENNLHLLQQETEKLALFVGEGGEVTKDIAANVISVSLHFSALELVDVVLKKDFHSAIKIFKDLEKKKEDPIGLIAFLAYQFRIIFQVKLLQQKGYSRQLMQKELKVHPYVVKLASERSKFFSKEKLSGIINKLANTDAAIKKGKVEKGIAFELLLYNIIKT